MVWKHPRDISRRKVYGPAFKDKHWNDCFNKWLEWLRFRNEVAETALTYERRARNFFTDPGRNPDTYIRQEIEAFLQSKNKRTGKKCKPASYNGKLATLKSFYEYASTYEYTFRGKTKMLLPGRLPTFGIHKAKTSSRSRAFKEDELARVFRAIDEGPRNQVTKKLHRALFLTYLWSGRRAAEIARLRWRDIDVVQTYDEGKNEMVEAWIYHWRGKGHIEVDDSMQMPPDAVHAIIDYLESDNRWGKMQPGDAIFPGRWPPMTMHPGSISTILHRYCKAAGIDEAGIHRFRHTAAMDRWGETKDIVYVQKFLRHKNLNATMVYVNPEQGQMDLVAAKLRGRYSRL